MAEDSRKENRRRIIELEKWMGDARVEMTKQTAALEGLAGKFEAHADYAKEQHTATAIGMTELKDVLAVRKTEEQEAREKLRLEIKEDIQGAVKTLQSPPLESPTETASMDNAKSWDRFLTFLQSPIGAVLVLAVLGAFGIIKGEVDKQDYLEAVAEQRELLEDLEAEVKHDESGDAGTPISPPPGQPIADP